MEHFGYLFAAYSIIFAAIFLYVVFIWRRQARLEAEVRAMEERLKALKSAAANPPQPSEKAQGA
jgi:CcmD family protein